MQVMQETKSLNRLNGLDTLRAIAIIIVLMYHYMCFVSHQDNFGYLSQLGWAGVDLFFVLSGYLIGNQVISAFALRQPFSIKIFFARRLLRTLPNYYVVLSLYFMLPDLLSGSARASLWSFLSFTQNFSLHYGETFTHSWSLCIEEQFYLLFPVVALLMLKMQKSIRWVWSIIIVVIVAGIAMRGFQWFAHGQAQISARDYSEHIYYSTFCRFDELLPGVAIALFKNYHPHLFNRWMQKANVLSAIGLVCVLVICYLFTHYHVIENYGYGFWMTAFGYSLLAISFALLVLSALSPHSLLNKIRVPGAARLALWSYAIYLIHRPLFTLVQKPLAQYAIDPNSSTGIALVMGVSILSGWLLYQLVETPFMKLRAKYYPVNYALKH